jgi:bisphosphoglycerate-independent phosphoglycerate mutase (AlkP superfamily)
MHGTICRSSCVSQVNNVATCDPACTDNTGDAVLVDDQGNVQKIAQESQSMCPSHMGKHVTMMAFPSAQGREQALRIQELRNDSGGG